VDSSAQRAEQWQLRARGQLRLAGTIEDLDSVVEIEIDPNDPNGCHPPPTTPHPPPSLPPRQRCTLLFFPMAPLTRPISGPLLAPGGRGGRSTAQRNCGVFIGRWRPASKVDPHLRARVAVKVMMKDDVLNRDIPYLLTMNFPYVNHFRGEFGTSQQLKVPSDPPGPPLTIMVSSYCAGGDHFSAIAQPVQGAGDPTDPYSIHLQFVRGSGFCFGNPDFDGEQVNHGMPNPLPPPVAPTTVAPKEVCHYLSFICVQASPSAGVICRVEKRDERFFQLFCSDSDPQCHFPYDADAPRRIDQFTREFVLPPGVASAACCMLIANADDQGVIRSFEKCMPRPNAPFLRAFAVQLLRGLGYCHSRKLTSHNGEQRINAVNLRRA
jgi:hypothetical protein